MLIQHFPKEENIDTGTIILEQSFGLKTSFFNTYSNIQPAKINAGGAPYAQHTPEAVGAIA